MILQIGKYGDNTYLLPYVYSNWGLIYNQTYLDQIDSYGEYTKGEWPKTMQGLIDLCTATKSAGLVNARTKQTVKPFSCGLTVNYMNYLFYALWDELDSEGLTAYLNQSNTSMYDASEFNSAEVKQVFETLYDLIGAKSETESNLCSAAEDHLDSQKNFVNGNCVFTFSGVWFETEMQTILKSVGMTSYHYGAYPVINSADQNRLYMNLPGEYFFIPSDAENVWGAKDFLAFCMSEEGIAAAERKLSMPLAYTTDEKVEFTSFGKEIQTVVDNSKKLYVYSTSNIYKTGALTFFLQTTNPFIQMSKYRITSKSDIVSKCITTEIAQHNATWDDYMKHLS
jgi:ABC-type glycerol-3-phosphate transport system substrate-binding protein